jgi:tRNA A37 threonylcarbamoyladenosine modification protein TsaB
MLYLGLYDDAARKLEGPLLIAPAEALALLPPNLRVATGSGAALLVEAGTRQGRVIEPRLPELQPSAGALAEIASASGERLLAPRPLYLRPPDARPQAQAISRR